MGIVKIVHLSEGRILEFQRVEDQLKVCGYLSDPKSPFYPGWSHYTEKRFWVAAEINALRDERNKLTEAFTLLRQVGQDKPLWYKEYRAAIAKIINSIL